MACLHRAARVAHIGRCDLLLEKEPTLATQVTYLSRAPGGCTPLMLLAEADQYHMNLKTIQPVTTMLIRNMDLRSLTSVNTKMNNFVQLAVSRGNVWFLEVSLPLLARKCQFKEEFESILQNINEKGKASLDMAIYNKRIWKLLEG